LTRAGNRIRRTGRTESSRQNRPSRRGRQRIAGSSACSADVHIQAETANRQRTVQSSFDLRSGILTITEPILAYIPQKKNRSPSRLAGEDQYDASYSITPQPLSLPPDQASRDRNELDQKLFSATHLPSSHQSYQIKPIRPTTFQRPRQKGWAQGSESSSRPPPAPTFRRFRAAKSPSL